MRAEMIREKRDGYTEGQMGWRGTGNEERIKRNKERKIEDEG